MKQNVVDLFNEQADIPNDDDMELRSYVISEYGQEYYERLMNLPLSYRDAAIQNFKNVLKRKKKFLNQIGKGGK